MFSLSLKAILATFEKLQAQLEEFIKVQNEKLEVNKTKVEELQRQAQELLADRNRAANVATKIEKLIE